MKHILKQSVLFLAVFCLIFSFASCRSGSKTGSYDAAPSIGGGYGDIAAAIGREGGVFYEKGGVLAGADASLAADGGYSGDGGVLYEAAEDATGGAVDVETEKPAEIVRPNPGQITVGAQNDNLYYKAWLRLFEQGTPESETGNPNDATQSQKEGKFYQFLSEKSNWGIPSGDRVTVKVLCKDQPVAGAQVVATGAGGASFRAVTDATGTAYLFPNVKEGSVTVTSGSQTATETFSADRRELTVSLEEAAQKANVIELMFVVDVTGSMGDELSYLKSELDDVVRSVAAANTDAKINLALLFYRDTDDDVPFYYVDFKNVTDSKNLKAQMKALEAQRADGGGDYEEAVDEALQLAVSKQWSANATKMIFLVLDAPAHSGQVYETRFSQAVRRAAEQGIRICPILASGADTVCEYTTRSAAILTGGTFLFITNHSGIGGDHLDPDLPNVTIEYLNACLVRLINGYLTGTFAEPVAWDAQS